MAKRKKKPDLMVTIWQDRWHSRSRERSPFARRAKRRLTLNTWPRKAALNVAAFHAREYGSKQLAGELRNVAAEKARHAKIKKRVADKEKAKQTAT